MGCDLTFEATDGSTLARTYFSEERVNLPIFLFVGYNQIATEF